MTRQTQQPRSSSPDPHASSPTLTRRDFVRASAGAAIVAPFALSPLSVAASAFAAGSDQIKVGLVGCGGRGTGAAVNALDADPGVVIHAMADAFSDKLASSLANLRSKASDRVTVDESRSFVGFDAYKKLLATDIDVVILATPIVFRPEHLRASVLANKHIFCEKSMSVDGPGVRSVLESGEMARQRGLSLVAGYCWRYSDPEQAAYREIHEGRMGAVRAVHTRYNTGGWVDPPARKPEWSDMEYQIRAWHYFKEFSGDHIVEQACHSIDKIAWALNGEVPTQCIATGGRALRTLGNVYDNFNVIYEYASGARGFHICRQIENTPFDNNDYIMGEKGYCFMNSWGRNPGDHQITGENPWTYPEDGLHRNMYQTEHEVLFDSIRNNKKHNDGTWMAHSTLMAIMGRMAAYTGQTVTWEQALNSKDEMTLKQWAWGNHEMLPVAVPGRTPLV